MSDGDDGQLSGGIGFFKEEETDLKTHARMCSIRYKLLVNRFTRLERLTWLVLGITLATSLGVDGSRVVHAALRYLVGG